MIDRPTKIVPKPWGREEWLALNERYCYKRIYLTAGYRTSKQYHRQKLETNYVVSGTGRALVGDSWYDVSPGDFFTVQPGIVHRIEAITDLILQEVSTPEVDDVVRVEDDSGRI